MTGEIADVALEVLKLVEDLPNDLDGLVRVLSGEVVFGLDRLVLLGLDDFLEGEDGRLLVLDLVVDLREVTLVGAFRGQVLRETGASGYGGPQGGEIDFIWDFGGFHGSENWSVRVSELGDLK